MSCHFWRRTSEIHALAERVRSANCSLGAGFRFGHHSAGFFAFSYRCNATRKELSELTEGYLS